MRATFCLDIQTFEYMGLGEGGTVMKFCNCFTDAAMQREESAETVKLPIV